MSTIHAISEEIHRLEALILANEKAAADEARKENWPFANMLLGRAEGYRRDLDDAWLSAQKAIEEAMR